MRVFPEYCGPMADWPRVEIMPGVAQVLLHLQGRVGCCVASNAGDSDAELMAAALERVGIRTHFQHLFTSKELGVSKPDPTFFVEIARRLDVVPQECCSVGDNYERDIAAAKVAGMQTIWFTDVAGSNLYPAADAFVNSMTDLVSFF